MKRIMMYLLLAAPAFSQAQVFVHSENEVQFVALLKRVKDNLPASLKGYQVATLVNGLKEASANLERTTSLAVDLDAKKLSLTIVDPPKKDGAQRKSGNLTTEVYLENGKVWIEQKFARDPVANWKLPVNVVGESLQAPASEFRYSDMSPAALETRKNDLTYNFKQRTIEAGLSETAATQYNFEFVLDTANKSLYMDRVAIALTSGEKDDAGQDALKNIQSRISVSALVQSDIED